MKGHVLVTPILNADRFLAALTVGPICKDYIGMNRTLVFLE